MNTTSSTISQDTIPYATWQIDPGRWLLARHEPWRGWLPWLGGVALLALLVLLPLSFAIAVTVNTLSSSFGTGPANLRPATDPTEGTDAIPLFLSLIFYVISQAMLVISFGAAAILLALWLFLAAVLWDVLHIPFTKNYRPKEWFFRTTILADRGGIGLEKRQVILRHLTWYPRSRVADIRAKDHYLVVDLDFPSETRCLAQGLNPQQAQQLAQQLHHTLELPPT
ncbi:MAG: hypothetical protein EA402_10740 [Planctomycetota bacterium]|nr:MAG: hypothetical protein EA402_10740 [Planctomycetota bacterium]